MALVVKVRYDGGVIKTLPILEENFSISNTVNATSNLSFTVDDTSGTYGGIRDGSSVSVLLDGEKIFGGMVLNSNERDFYRSSRIIDVECVDNSDALKADLVGEVAYEDRSVTFLVNYIVGCMEADFTSVNVNSTQVIEAVDFGYETGYDALNKVIELIDGIWYVDEDLNLYVYDKSNMPRARAITTADVEGRPSLEYDGSEYVNKVVFSDFHRVSDQVTQTFYGDDSARSFEFKQNVYSIVSITRSHKDGTNSTSQTFAKIQDEEELTGKDWFFELNTKVLYQTEDADALPLYDYEKLVVKYKPLVKRKYTYKDTVEMNSYYSRNGVIRGKATLFDGFVIGDASAEATGKRIVKSLKDSNISFSIRTSVAGYRAGRVVKVTIPAIDVIGVDFYIKSVDISVEDGNVVYTLSMNRGYLLGKWVDRFSSKSSSVARSRTTSGNAKTKPYKSQGGTVVAPGTDVGSGGSGGSGGSAGVADVAKKIYMKNSGGDNVGTVDIYFRKG